MMKIMRRVLCILGVCGLFSIYQFDAVAKCSSTSAGRFCKLSVNTYKCRAGCYCLENSAGADVGSIIVDTWCNRTRNPDLGSDKVEILHNAKVFRCPDEFPDSDEGATSEEDCYFCRPSSPNICLPVKNQQHHLAPGQYMPAGTGNVNTCKSSTLGLDVYCPGGDFKPSIDYNIGVYSCDGDSVGTSDLKNCKIECNVGQYLNFVYNRRTRRNDPSCEWCPDGYGCPGNKTWIVAGNGRVTTEQGKYACPDGASSNNNKSACKIQCGQGTYLKSGNICQTCPKGYKCEGMTAPVDLVLNGLPPQMWEKHSVLGLINIKTRQGNIHVKLVQMGNRPT